MGQRRFVAALAALHAAQSAHDAYGIAQQVCQQDHFDTSTRHRKYGVFYAHMAFLARSEVQENQPNHEEQRYRVGVVEEVRSIHSLPPSYLQAEEYCLESHQCISF